MSTIVSNGEDETIEIMRVKNNGGLLIMTQTSSDTNASGYCDTTTIFFPKERIASIIAALEDEAGV
jgi:hypothetical protein